MANPETTREHLYEIQAFLFEYEDDKQASKYAENRSVYLQVLKLLAVNKGFGFIADELNDPNVGFDETLTRWNSIFTHLISEELSNLEPDKKHRLFLKKITEMTGYEYRDYLNYLKEEGLNSHLG